MHTRLKALVADDIPDCRDTLAVLLEMSGDIDVFRASDGREAVEISRNIPFDLAVLDVGMPVMDGIQAAKAIRSTQTHAPYLVALTGYGDSSVRRQTTEAGFDEHLLKPLDPGELERVLGHVRSSSRPCC